MNFPGAATLSAPLQAQIRKWVMGVFPREDRNPVDYDHPVGDPGLFGPQSVTWKIHGDFPGMMSGGICALMLQTLHPLALAGVWDHSNFRADLVGRLRRTTTFVAATTYAPTREAERLIARVAGIHERVRGHAEDGRAYSAADPDLLTWVHVTEMSSFLAGYLRYCRPSLPVSVQDRYYWETSRIAEALGARRVPKSVAGVEAYFRRIQPQLEFSARSVEVLGVLKSIRLPIPDGGASRRLFLGSAAVLLPDWALNHLRRSRLERLRDAAAARTLQAAAPLVRAALKDGVGARSCARTGVDRSILYTW